jgi:diadenosine tetraphosphate (Ap4A) HIT family hydrolase
VRAIVNGCYSQSGNVKPLRGLDVSADDFILDPRLAADTTHLGDWQLCSVLLAKDSRFPWLILVPRRAGLVDLIDVDRAERGILTIEIDRAARALKNTVPCDKLNVGALGNMVRQLHIHVIARKVGDAAWPKPVWGVGQPEPYADNDTAEALKHAMFR